MSCGDCCGGVTTVFDERRARRTLRDYRQKGPGAPTGALLAALREHGASSGTLLDVGGGVGVIAHELLRDGMSSATVVDASPAYLDAAREESARQGTDDRLRLRLGDVVELADELPPADVVTLDKVVCCYADMDSLLSISAARARRIVGLVYPRDSWWVRVAIVLENQLFRLRGNPFRSFVHPNVDIEAALRRAGFDAGPQRRGAWWVVGVFERRAGAVEKRELVS